MSNDPLRDVQRVAAALHEHDPAIAEWFARGVDAFLSGAERSLDGALGLSGPGIDSPVTRLARARRNDALRLAWSRFPPLNAETDRQRRRRFLRLLLGFEIRVLPRIRSGARLPADDFEVALYDAMANGSLPRHERSLQRILDGQNWT